MDSFSFLERPPRGDPKPVYVVHGDEDFLKRQVITALRAFVLGSAEDTLGLSAHPGDTATYAAVHDELETLPFLSPRRLVIVENADPFVTLHRARLEKYVAQPASAGVLVLDVKLWPANTRLAKLIDSAATITCKSQSQYKLPEWCVSWAASRHAKQLTVNAARMLVDLIGADMGQLDQELTKLAIYVGTANRIDQDDVDKLVGSSRAESTWKIFD